jgi:fructokinase
MRSLPEPGTAGRKCLQKYKVTMKLFGGIEAGGTKFICGIGTCPDDLVVTSFPTASPSETIGKAINFFREKAGDGLAAIGIGSFGPIDCNLDSERYGYITKTPKPGWDDYNFVGPIAQAFAMPVAFDTDVNAAALAESRWGAAKGMDHFLYLTVGTGIGGGVVVNGQPVHGLMHPEMGHIRVPHDIRNDPFPGKCPFHKDCLEGLASGEAIRNRWKQDPKDLPPDHPAWSLEAHYLALALSTWVCTLSPQRIVLGGGVMQQRSLFPMIRARLRELLGGYIPHRLLSEDVEKYVVPPALDDRSGVLGAILLGEQAYLAER